MQKRKERYGGYINEDKKRRHKQENQSKEKNGEIL